MSRKFKNLRNLQALLAFSAIGFVSAVASAETTTHADLQLTLPAKPTKSVVDIGDWGATEKTIKSCP